MRPKAIIFPAMSSVFAAITVVTMNAFAQDTAANTSEYHLPKTMDQSLGYSTLLQVVLWLVAVLALIWLMAWVIKAFTKGRRSGWIAGKNMRVLESMTLGAGRLIHLISVGKRILLISSSSTVVNFIYEVHEDECVDIWNKFENAQCSVHTSSTHLDAILGRLEARRGKQDSTTPAASESSEIE